MTSTSATTYRHPGAPGMPDTTRATLYRHTDPRTGRIVTSTNATAPAFTALVTR